MKPLGTGIFIQLIKTESVTQAGIILTDRVDTPKALVVAVGTEVKEIKEGMTIVYENRPKVFMVDGKEVSVILESDVIAYGD